MNKLASAINDVLNLTSNEKGALAHKSTLDPVLDYFSRAGAMRQSSELDVSRLFLSALSSDTVLAVKTMFYLRDIRGGQGERKVFRTALVDLANTKPALASAVLKLVPEYGRWDDLFCLFGTKVEAKMLEFLRQSLLNDISAFNEGKAISLLAKWLPSENTSSQKTRNLARKVRSYLNYDSRSYRQLLSKLRNHIDVVERKMCANEWSHIAYEKVPSRAAMIYRKSFESHDSKRYNEFISKVKSGEAKINAGTLYPYDIVQKCLYAKDDTLDVLWSNLPNYIKNPTNALVVADVSGSMMGMPLNVAISLALYISERNSGLWKDKFLTFSQKPELVEVVGKTISQKVSNLSQASWGMNTNLNATFDLILKAAKSHNLSNDDMPKTLFIISDMQFDAACGDKTNFEYMKQQYAACGYDMPKVVFWNVRAAQNSPAKATDENVMLVSGASPSIFEAAVNCSSITPIDSMMEVLNAKRYSLIEEALA